MRVTEENIHVKGHDHVFEIMYQYHNPEASTPYPEKRKASEIPEGVRIWAIEINCRKECNKLIKAKK